MFLGVYPLNKIPYISIRNKCAFIVNSQTSNLGGEHWIAVFNKPDVIKVFDPLGFYYPNLLVSKLQLLSKRIEYNKVQCQHPLTFTCGSYCLLWLKYESL